MFPDAELVIVDVVGVPLLLTLEVIVDVVVDPLLLALEVVVEDPLGSLAELLLKDVPDSVDVVDWLDVAETPDWLEAEDVLIELAMLLSELDVSVGESSVDCELLLDVAEVVAIAEVGTKLEVAVVELIEMVLAVGDDMPQHEQALL